MTTAVGPGQLLAGRYRLQEHVASGGAGSVWRAMDLVLERVVAVKVLRSDVADDSAAVARFRQEARSASRLSHPGIAQVYDYGVADPGNVPFLVMELVHGPSLADVLTAGALDPDRAMDVLAQVATGLHAAHSAGVVHRDIKPANLLTSRDGRVKITDFGIARVVGTPPVTSTGAILGTPAYLAPERMAGASATPASDLYSLGMVAYECLTGTRPFNGSAPGIDEALGGRPLPPLPSSVPVDIDLLVAELTARDPSQRPRSAREVAARAASLRLGPTGQTPLDDKWNWGPAAEPAAEPVTLTDASTTAPPGESAFHLRPVAWRRRRGWRATGAWLAIAAALVVVGLVGWRAGLTRASGSPRPVPPSNVDSPAVRSVAVDSAAFVGVPANLVVADLRRLGLRPVLVRVATSAQPPGAVLSVQPGGTLQPGAIVTVVAAVAPPQVFGNFGNGGGDGHDGGGGGDGGSGGGDGGGGGGH